MSSSKFRAVLLGVALAFASATSGGAAPAPLRVVSESLSGLELAWTPESQTRVERLALPPGTRAVLAPDAPEGARLEEGGWYRRTRFVRLVLEPGAGPEQRVRIGFVPESAAPVIDAIPPDQAGIPAGALTRGELSSGLRFFNALTAGRVDELLSAAPELRPRLAPSRPTGALRRRAASAPTADSASAPGRWPGGEPGLPRADGFETGRLLIEIGLPGVATVDRGDGTWRVLDPDGIYRISWSQLADAGHVIDGVAIDELRLTRWARGPSPVEVALLVHDDNGNSVFDDGDSFEFWGQALRGEDCAGCFQQADYTDVNAYVLDSAPGARIRMATPRTPIGTLPESADRSRTLRFEVGNRFIGPVKLGLAGVDHFYWCGALTWRETLPEQSRSETLELPGLRRGSSRPAAVRVNLLAKSTLDHRSLVDVNGFNVSDIESDGAILELHDAALQASDLRPDTEVTIRLPVLPAGPGRPVDQFELDWIEIQYPSSFAAENDRLWFPAGGGESVTVTGLSATDEFSVFDVSDPLNPVPIEPLSVTATSVSFEAETAGRYAVAAHPGGEGAVPPLALTWLPSSNLRDPANDADLLAIGPRTWLFESDGSLRPAVQAWADLRQSQGVSVLPVAIEEVLAEFSGGVWTPSGTFYFLQYALLEWQGPPEHALLIGDTTTDYKGQLEGRILFPSDCSDFGLGPPCNFNEPAWFRGVQTVMQDNPADLDFVGHYATDARLATVVGGDSVPDYNLGRLPARTVAEFDRLLDKLLAYDQLVDSPPAWGSRVHLVGGAIDPSEPGELRIEEAQERARLAHVEPEYTAQTYYYQSDYGGVDPLAFSADLLAGWQDPGAAVVSYVGHGNALNWDNEALLTNNAPSQGCRNDVLDSLSDPSTPLPVVVNVGCITGAFMRDVGPSLLEELVRSPGGAIATYGPTGLTDISLAATIVDGFIGGIHGREGRGRLLGEVVQRLQARLALAGLNDAALGDALLGDPSMRFAIPFGPPADGILLEATPGDGVVVLSWPAVAGADSYAIYRREVGSPDEPLVAGTTAALNLDDTGVVNGVEYEYWLEPATGPWPGRWSDPAVRARPCTTTPPDPPANVMVTRFLDRIVRLDWDASPTAGIAGYRVRIFAGPDASGEPIAVRDTSVPNLVFGPLDRCREYTYEVHALGWCEFESLTAALTRGRGPDCAIVADPPRTVRDLRLRRSGDDLLLDWSAVTETLQGSPFTLVQYQVHRAEAADFLASAMSLEATDPTPGFTVTGAAAGGGPVLEFYSVAAEADSGLTGGIGRDFPLGVTDLAVTDAGLDWSLAWSAVTADLDGARTALRAYQVHASAAPLDASTAGPLTLVETLPPDALSTLVPKVPGDVHLVLAEDVHGNLSPF